MFNFFLKGHILLSHLLMGNVFTIISFQRIPLVPFDICVFSMDQWWGAMKSNLDMQLHVCWNHLSSWWKVSQIGQTYLFLMWCTMCSKWHLYFCVVYVLDLWMSHMYNIWSTKVTNFKIKSNTCNKNVVVKNLKVVFELNLRLNNIMKQ